MKKEVVLEKNIEYLKLSNKIMNKLKDNNIVIVKDLWNLNRKELKQLGLLDNEISQIVVKLQLHALDLNQKVY